MDRLRTRLTYANVMATVAVFIALGGASYAAVALPMNSVGSKQIKNGQIKTADLAKNAVVSSTVKDGSLLSQDFKAGQLPAGAPGVAGGKGPQGDTGLQGPKGDTGLQGLKGDTGLQGLKGNTGSKGPKGDTGPATGAAGGDLTGNYPNPTIGAGKINSAALADGAVTAAKASLTATFQPLPFSGTWTGYAAPYPPAGAAKDASGFVHLRGAVFTTSSTTATAIAVLPAGLRPVGHGFFDVVSSDGSGAFVTNCTLHVYPDGTLDVYPNASNKCLPGFISLEQITFFAG